MNENNIIRLDSSYDLKYILDHVIDGFNLKWKILWMEILGGTKLDNTLELEEKINESEEGFLINWIELIELSSLIEETIEILIIADTDINKLKKYNTDSEMHLECSLCIEMVDSSYWELTDNSGNVSDVW